MRGKVTAGDVANLARLAGLELSPAQQERLAPMMEALLAEMAHLEEADRTGMTQARPFPDGKGEEQ